MDEPAIDRAVFAELQATAGAEFVTELVGTFLQEAPDILADLRRGLELRDADRFRRAAHSLKSNGTTFGAVRLAALARDLELKGFDAEPDRDKSALAALEAAYGVAAAELKALSHV